MTHPDLARAAKAARVRAMFGRIAPRYDLMNALMTAGLDRRWRRLAADAARPAGALALDLATGTGDLARALAAAGARRVVAVDFTPAMLAAARRKIGADGAARGRVALCAGDALRLPFADGAFDCAVNGFLLRNVADLPRALAELHRVLAPGGRLCCLELTPPPRWFAPAFRLYFDGLVPLVGALVAGDLAAYRYLPASLRPFPRARTLARMLAAVGFAEVRYRRLGLGTVALHIAVKPARDDLPRER